MFGSVADPGCLSRIPDTNNSIPDPGSKRLRIPDLDPHRRLSIFNQTIISKLSEIRFGMFIPDPDLDIFRNTDVKGTVQRDGSGRK
jgi:hypothetical protein